MENKILGSLEISKGVLCDLIGYATLECYGVVGVANANTTDTFLRILPVSRLRRGINVVYCEGKVVADVYVVIEYGTNVTTVCDNLRERIEFVLNEYAGISDCEINIHVADVNVRK